MGGFAGFFIAFWGEKKEKHRDRRERMQIQRKNRYRLIRLAVLFFCLSFGLNGCAKLPIFSKDAERSTTAAMEETSTSSPYIGIFGVVIALDTETRNITILNINNRETVVLAYGVETMVQNKYGDGISMAQVRLGEIVDLKYDREGGRVKEVTISPDAWELNYVTQFTMDRTNKIIQTGSHLYQYDSSIAIISDGELVEPIEISDQDELTIKGCGTTAYSITVTKGHGYVSLENEELFLGGILTIGKIAKPITANMLVVVPEGDYTLEITQESVKGRKQIRVEKNKELEVDIRSFIAEARQIGTVNFKIEPENAILYINGKETNHKEVAALDYGTYAIRVEAEGYVPFSEKYQVETSYREKMITLEATEENTETAAADQKETSTAATSTERVTSIDQTTSTEKVTNIDQTTSTEKATNIDQTTSAEEVTSGSTTQHTSAAEETTIGAPSSVSSGDVSSYKIHIMEPSQTEVYFDGDYIGTSPVTLTKVSGEHTIILKKDGYVTKTYTVNITSDQIDSYYSFPALAEN